TGARPIANHTDMLSTCSCHFGGFFGFFGRRIRRHCRIAAATRTIPITILTARAVFDGDVCGLGGLLPVASTVTATTIARDTSHPNTNAAPFHATLGGQHDHERRQRYRVDCYRQADQDEIQRHGHPSRLTLTDGVSVDDAKLYAASGPGGQGVAPMGTV